jgi:hypothetical protein
MRIFTAAFAIAAGFIVLLGYFFPAQLEPLRLLLVDWAILIAGMAVLVGIFNLVAVQMEKIRTRQKGGMYGVILIVSLFITFVSGLLTFSLPADHPYRHFYSVLTMDAIIVPVEASLMAILAVTLVYASIRLLRRRVDVMSVLFLVVAVIFLIAIMPTPFGPLLGERGNQAVVNFLETFSHGGTRGLLIGIALGTLLTGLRVLFGIDRPYGGN